MVIARAVPKLATWRYTSIGYGVLLLAGALDLYMSFVLARTVYRHDNAPVSFWLYVMEASIVLVQMGIWWIALRAARDFMGYIQEIKTSTDGRGMSDIAWALMWLIVYIVLVPLTTTLAEVTQHHHYNSLLVFLHNHLPVLAMILAVGYLYRGSRRLVALTGRPLNRTWLILTTGLYLIVAGLFIWHFLDAAPHIFEGAPIVRFVLPLRVLMFTYALPHVVAWFVGVMAIFNLWHYSTQVEGSIYRRLFSNLYRGIFLVFAGTFIAQLLIASTVTLSSFNAGAAIVYVVLLTATVGYVLIYKGVNQLVKVEMASART